MLKRLITAFALLCALPAFGQVVGPILQPHSQFVDNSGAACSGCLLYSYAAGTSTPQATYTDSTGTSQNTNPIVLDISGSANIWLGGSPYKFVLTSSTGSTLWTVDSVPGSFYALLPLYLPLAGGTLTGNLNGTTANFSGAVTALSFVGAGTGLTGTASSLTAGLATAIAGGALGSAPYQSAAGATSFLPSPTTSGHTFIYGWQPSGAAIAPSVLDLGTYLASPPAIGGTAAGAGTFTVLQGATSVQVAAGTAMTGNQGNGVKVQHSTGSTTTGDIASYDSNGNVVDSGSALPSFTGTSGYQALSAGLVMAWATGSSVSADSVQTISLPTTFAHACLAAWSVNLDPSETTNITKNWAIVSCSTTSVVTELQRRGDEGSFSAQPKVFAVGW